jgi:aromatic-L-amino-acid/L-tryptophan decarboxylase
MSSDPTLSLDPDAMRALGYRVVDLLVERFQAPPTQIGEVKSRSALEATLQEPPPELATDPMVVIERLEKEVFANTLNLCHPRFFAFVPSPSNFVSAMASALVAGHNVFAGTWLEASGPAQIELVTVDWVRQLLGLPPAFGGAFVTGGSAANLTALVAARTAKLGDSWQNGRVYASAQTHSSVARAMRAIGFSNDALVSVECDSKFRLDPEQLALAIRRDRAAGKRPFAIVANAGTTNTGAVDPLRSLSAIARMENLWLHVDGAYGAAAALVPEKRSLFDGVEDADSLTIDPHKWWFQPYECGLLLVREPKCLRDTFQILPEYLRATERDHEEVNFCDYGLQLTRDFKALKLWMSLKVYGAQAFRDAVERGIRLAEHAERRIAGLDGWKIVTPAQLGVVTFRHTLDASRDDIQDRIVETVVASKLAFLATTSLRGSSVIRLCTIHPRATAEDIDITVDALDSAARSMVPG